MGQPRPTDLAALDLSRIALASLQYTVLGVALTSLEYQRKFRLGVALTSPHYRWKHVMGSPSPRCNTGGNFRSHKGPLTLESGTTKLTKTSKSAPIDIHWTPRWSVNISQLHSLL